MLYFNRTKFTECDGSQLKGDVDSNLNTINVAFHMKKFCDAIFLCINLHGIIFREKPREINPNCEIHLNTCIHINQ